MVVPVCPFCGRITVRPHGQHKRYFNPVDAVLGTTGGACACAAKPDELKKLLSTASDAFRQWQGQYFSEGPPDRSHKMYAEWVDVNRSLDWLKTIARGKGIQP